MNPTSTSTHPTNASTTAQAAGWGGYETHRRLDEPVLPSAAEEVRMETGNSPASSQRSAGRAGSFPDGSAGSAGKPWLTQMQDQLGQYVAAKPVKAALMAAGVGALAALVLGQRSSRARRSPRS